MDIIIPIVELNNDDFNRYVGAVIDSNMPLDIMDEIIDFLLLAVEQTEQAASMGWLADLNRG